MPATADEKIRQREFSEAQRMSIIQQQAGLTLPAIPGSAPYRFQSPEQAEQYLYPTEGKEEADDEEDDETVEEYSEDESFETDFEGQTELSDEDLEELASSGSLEDTEEDILQQDEASEDDWRRKMMSQKSKIAEAAKPKKDAGMEKSMGVSSGTLNAFLRINPQHPGNNSLTGMLASLIRNVLACFGGAEIVQQFQTVLEQGESKTGGQSIPLIPGENTEAQVDYILVFTTVFVGFLLCLLIGLPAIVIFFMMMPGM
jgi:hypothetical protein